MADASSFDSPIIDSPVRAGEGSGLLHEVGPSWELRGVGVEDLYDASLAQVATEALHKDPADRGEADIMCITTWLAKQRHVLAKHLGDAGVKPSQDLLRYLARHISLVNFEPGTLVYRQGEVGGAFYIVVRGSVHVFHKAWTHADDHVFGATSGHGVNVQEDGTGGGAAGAGAGSAGAGAGATGGSPLGMLIGELAESDSFGEYHTHAVSGVRRTASVVARGVGSGELATLAPTEVIQVPAACFQRYVMPVLAAGHRERQRLVRMLRRLRMFEDWPDPELEFMASWMKPVTLGRHDVLYYEGSIPEQVYFLAQGTVMLTGTAERGDRTIVEAVTAPGVVGTLELVVDKAVRMYDARTVGDHVTGARISADRFRKLVLTEMAAKAYDSTRHLQEVCCVRQRWHEARLALMDSVGARDQRHTVVDLHAYLLLPIQARVIPCPVCGLTKGHVAFDCDKLPRELGSGGSSGPTRVPVLTVRMPDIVGRSPHGAPKWRMSSPRTPRTPRLSRGRSGSTLGSRKGSTGSLTRGRPPSPLATAASRPGSAGGSCSGGELPRSSPPAVPGPLRMSDRLVTLRFPGQGHARSVSSGSDAGSNGGDSGRASSQSRGHSGRGAAALGGARTGRTLFRARRVEDIQAEADRGRASPRSRSPRRRSLDHVLLSARGSPKTSPSSPQATRHRSRRHSLVLSIIGARRPRASSGAGRGGPLARLAGAGLDPTHSPGGVDWNAPSPRPPSPTFLALADAAFEMGVVARVALMLKRAVRTFKMRQPSRFRHHHRVCVRRPQLPEPCSSPDSDDVLSGFLAPRPRASFRRSSRSSLSLASGSSARLTRSVSSDGAYAGRSSSLRLSRTKSHGSEHLDPVAEDRGAGHTYRGPSPSRDRRTRRASRHRRAKSGGAVSVSTRSSGSLGSGRRGSSSSSRRLSWIRAGASRQPGSAAMERHSLRAQDGGVAGDMASDPALVGGDGVAPSRTGTGVLARRRPSSTASLHAGAAPGQTLKPATSSTSIGSRRSSTKVHPAGPDSIDIERARRLAVALESPSPTRDASGNAAAVVGDSALRDTVVHRRSRLGTGLVTSGAAAGAGSVGAGLPLRTTSNSALPRSAVRVQTRPSLRARSLGSLAPSSYDGSVPGFR